MEHSFPLSIGQGGFTVPSDIDCLWNSSIDWPSVFAIERSSLFLNSTCSDWQQFAHCVQSMRAKYFWLKVLTRPSMSSGAYSFSHDRNFQFSSSCSCESCWILERSISIVGILACFCSFIPASCGQPNPKEYWCQHRSLGRDVRLSSKPLLNPGESDCGRSARF